MMRHIPLIIIATVFVFSLQACSDSKSGLVNPWQTPVTLKSDSEINASTAISNDNGDLIIVWQEHETEERVNQALTDAHDPDIPYATTDLISSGREVPSGSGVVYDSSDDSHRSIAKQEDYGDHESHTHLNILQRTNIKARVYDSAAATWQTETALQTGFWATIQSGERYTDEAGATQVRITGNVGQGLKSHSAVTSNSGGDGIAVWIQHEESTTTTGDAASTYMINVSHYTATSNSWSTIETVSINQNLVLSDLSVTMDDTGKAQLLWLARSSTNNISNVYASAYDGSTWAAEQLLSDGNSGAKAVQVAMFSAGSGVAIWAQENTNGTSVFQGTDTDPCIATPALCKSTQTNLFGQWFDATGWQSPAVVISNALGQVNKFQLVSNNNNKVWAVWDQKPDYLTQSQDPLGNTIYPKELAANSQIWASQFDTSANAHTWSASVQLQADDVSTTTVDESAQHAAVAQASLDSVGNMMVVWAQKAVFSSSDAENTKWNNSVRQTVWYNIFKIDNTSVDGNGNTVTNDEWLGGKLLDGDERFSHETPKVISISENNFTAVWKRWSSLSQPFGHQLLSANYSADSNSIADIFEINTSADQINDFYLAKEPTKGVQVIWTGDSVALRQSTK